MDYEQLAKTIYTRRSHRKYSGRKLTAEERENIMSRAREVTPLYAEIKTDIRILSRSEIRSMMPWMPEDSIAIYSECKDGYLENAGFILGQMDLYVQSIGLGACWVGLAGPKSKAGIPDGLEFVILLAVGESRENMRNGISEFKRKSLGEICEDSEKTSLEPCRLAASSINSQPWYFVPNNGGFDVYMRKLVRTKGLARMNRIDVGIALAQLFVSNNTTFKAAPDPIARPLQDMTYIISVYI